MTSNHNKSNTISGNQNITSNKLIFDKAYNKAIGGGLSGSVAMVIQVSSLMWLRTTMNYQYRYGTPFTKTLQNLYNEGGFKRFYRGYFAALSLGPLARFGDVAANVSVTSYFDDNPQMKNKIPTPIQTVIASTTASLWRVFLMPLDTLKTTFKNKFETSIKGNNISKITQCSRLLDEILNRKPNQHLPYVGAAAFSHKGGLHVSAVQKDPKTYEHINPEAVGNSRNIVVSDQSGKSNIVSRLNSIGIDFKQDDPKIKKLLEEVKDREFIGYSYDGADASFELLARRIMGEIPRYISIKEYDVSVKKNNSGEIISSAKAKLEVDKKIILCEGEGNGPVHALDNAIRKNVDKLAKYSNYLKDLKLVDYKVRILNTGTEAVTRVSIESTDSKGKNWFTIGVSANIIDASFKALVDSLDYKLFKDKAPASL